jgi:hypothetical protein
MFLCYSVGTVYSIRNKNRTINMNFQVNKSYSRIGHHDPQFNFFLDAV